MRTYLAQRLVAIGGIAMGLMLPNLSWAAQQYQLVNGLAVYIGVLPAGMTMQPPTGKKKWRTVQGYANWEPGIQPMMQIARKRLKFSFNSIEGASPCKLNF